MQRVLFCFICATLLWSCCGQEISDVQRNITQLITSKGYPCEQHYAITEDGYILSMQHVPYGVSGPGSSQGYAKPVILLVHGLLDSSCTFAMNPANESLVFVLADAGFDVWLGNNRGNMYSRTNVYLSPDQPEFWYFSWDQMALYDAPAMIDYVLAASGASTLTWIGHSRGTQQLFAALSVYGEQLSNKLNLFVALAPVAYGYHVESPLLQALALFDDTNVMQNVFGVYDFLPNQYFMLRYLPDLCKLDPRACYDLSYATFGCCDSGNINQTRLPVYWAHFPAGTSAQDMAHFAQMLAVDGFQMYDWGSAEENVKHYNQSSPPQYDLGNIPMSLPIALFTGGNDVLADPQDVATLIALLPRPNPVYINYQPSYAHADFVWGENAASLIYPDIIKLIWQYSATR